MVLCKCIIIIIVIVIIIVVNFLTFLFVVSSYVGNHLQFQTRQLQKSTLCR